MRHIDVILVVGLLLAFVMVFGLCFMSDPILQL